MPNLQGSMLLLGYIAGSLTAVTVILKFPATKWVWYRIVVGPITEWQTRNMKEVIDPVVIQNTTEHAKTTQQLSNLDAKIDTLSHRVDSLSSDFDNTSTVLEEELGLRV